jgi:hypothetical protein
MFLYVISLIFGRFQQPCPPLVSRYTRILAYHDLIPDAISIHHPSVMYGHLYDGWVLL